jgi:hypothetical protein
MHFGHRAGRAIPTSIQPCLSGSTSVRTAIIRYAPRAVGLKPSAMECEARLRGAIADYFFKAHKPSAMECKARLRGRERNNDSKTVFLTRWNRSCPCTAWERGRLARMPGTRASCPTWVRGRLARMPGTRASCLAWERGRLARMPGSTGVSPALGARILPSTTPRGRSVLALQGQVLWGRLCSCSRFGLQDAQPPPAPFVGAGGRGDEGQKRTGMQQTAHRFQERSP